MENKVDIDFNNFTHEEIFNFQAFMCMNGVNVYIAKKDPTDNELGSALGSVVILFPLIAPFVVEFRKALEAYLNYRKSTMNWSITFKYGENELDLNGNDGNPPTLEEIKNFFDDHHHGIGGKGVNKSGKK